MFNKEGLISVNDTRFITQAIPYLHSYLLLGYIILYYLLYTVKKISQNNSGVTSHVQNAALRVAGEKH